MRKYLIELREYKKMTQQNVAEKIGISRQYYAMVENGERQNKMDITLATKLADALSVPLSDFIVAETKWQQDTSSGQAYLPQKKGAKNYVKP